MTTNGTASIALASTHVRSAVICGVTLLALAVPGVASAAQRFAGPGGSGTACTQAAPCGFDVAVNNAAAGDEVIVLAGDHGSMAAPFTFVFNLLGIDVHGQVGAARPRVFLGSGGFELGGAAASVRDLELRDVINSSGLTLSGGASATRMVVSSTLNSQLGGVCILGGTSSITDSICRSENSATGLTASSVSPAAVSVRNVTAIGGGTGFGIGVLASAVGTATLNATNVIARGAGGSADAFAIANPGTTATVTLDHSNFVTRSATGGGTVSVTDPATNANQSAAPLFADAVAGDFHELLGSPTIDAGAPAPVGALDLDGNPRTLDSAPDIGAYEFINRTPVVTTGAASAIGVSSVRLNAAVDPRGLATTARFDYGTTTAYGLQTAPVAFGALTGGQPLTAALTGLAPSTTYHFRAIASNSFASRVGSDAKFTTAAAAVSPPGAAPKLTLASKTVSVNVKTGRGSLKATCTAPAGQSCVFKGTLYGPGTLPGAKARAAKTRAKKIGAVTGTIAAGKQGRLRVKLTRGARKQLKRSHRLRARLRGTVTDTAGKHTSLRTTLTLKAKK